MNASSTGEGRAAKPAQPGLLRSLNNRVVLDLLIERGQLTRGDVRDLTGLSKPTASQLLARLVETGLVRPSGFGETGPGGRAPQLYEVNPTSGYAAAIDVRRERVTCRIADITGTVVGEVDIVPTRAASGPDSVRAAVDACCAHAGIALTDIDVVVVGVPGSYDVAGDRLHYADQLEGWHQPGIGDRLRTLLSPATVMIDNDVNLVALAEQRRAETGADNFFLLWLDEGIGGAIIIGGALHRGARGAAGEAAFLLAPGIEPDAATRTNGGLEEFAGREALRRLAASAGHETDTARAAMQALLETPDGSSGLATMARRYALGLASVIALIDPSRIVLSGELAHTGGPRLVELIARELDDLVVTHPSIELGRVIASPILEGGLILSLEHTRDLVFET